MLSYSEYTNSASTQNISFIAIPELLHLLGHTLVHNIQLHIIHPLQTSLLQVLYVIHNHKNTFYKVT